MLMIEEPDPSSMYGNARRASSNGTATMRWNDFCRSSILVSTNDGDPPAPALLTRTSRPPNASTVCVDDARKLIDVVEIRGDGDGATTRLLDLGGDHFHLGSGAGGDRHGRAGLREHARDGRTDAATAPGHEGDLALEREHVHFGALNDGI